MSTDRSHEHLLLARDLDRRDVDVAGRLATVAEVLTRVDDLRASAARIRSGLEGIPAEIEQAERDERSAREREASALQALAEAAQERERVVRSRRAQPEAVEQAERAAHRAETAAADATASVARHRTRIETLVREEAALQAAGEGLAVVARDVAAAVTAVPRLSDAARTEPGASLPEIEDWAARAHAALFVVRGSLVAERERLVGEASALAAAVLGEAGAWASVALVRRRIEETLGD